KVHHVHAQALHHSILHESTLGIGSRSLKAMASRLERGRA
ncbi:hypothetical protein A2U01_0085291, partial [Trifolium medium]|nr:hypothetical protein [Trifolium medium]